MKRKVLIGSIMAIILVAFGLTLQFGSSKEKVSEQFAKHLFEYPLPAETSLIAKHQYNGKNFLDGAGNGGYWNVVAIVELSSQLSKDKILKFYQGIALFPYPKGERRGVELEIYFEDDVKKIVKDSGYYYRSKNGGMKPISSYNTIDTSKFSGGSSEMKYILQLTSDFDYFLNFD